MDNEKILQARRFNDSRNKLYDEFKKDCERISKLVDQKEVLKELNKCKWNYDKKWIDLENDYQHYGLQGFVFGGCGTIEFNRYRNSEFAKLKQKHNLLSKEDQITYQKNKEVSNYQTFKEEFMEQEQQDEEKNTYTCAECFKDKTGAYLSCKEKNDGNKLCSKKCFREHYGEICNKCVKSCLEFHRDKDYPNITYCSGCWKKKQLEQPDQEWNPTIYCRYCSAKTELFDVCDKETCLAKMNKEIENKKDKDNNANNNSNLNIEREREREREQIQLQQQQLCSEISSLEQNSNLQNQSQLTFKKQQLKDLQTKEKQLTASLPLNTQISILEREIKDLASKSNKTHTEQSLLDSKKKELTELLSKQSNSNTNSDKSSDKTTLIIGCSIVGTLFLFFLILILTKNRKRIKN